MKKVGSFNSSSRYILKRRLGSGGSADVFLYSRETPGLPTQDVVLKMLKDSTPDGLRELCNEGRRLAELKHPHILPAFGYEQIDKFNYGLVLEYIPGSSLSKILPQIRKDDRGLIAAHIFRTLAGALHAAHVQGIIHGDVSTRNVLISDTGELKLCDFGLARRLQSKVSHSSLRRGSLDYLAPERWRGEPTSFGADIFALGVVAYEILAGRNPVCVEVGPITHQSLQNFLSSKPWRRFQEWERFFDVTLAEDVCARPTLAELVKMLPRFSAGPKPQEVLSLALRLTASDQSGSELLVTRLLRRRIWGPLPKALKVCLNFIIFVFVFVPQAIGTDRSLNQSRMRPSVLTVTSAPWGEVFIDGRSLGFTPILNQPLPGGLHRILWRGGSGDSITRTLMDYGNGIITYQIVKKKGSEAVVRPIRSEKSLVDP